MAVIRDILTFLDDGVADALQLLLLVLKLLHLSQLVGLQPVNHLHSQQESAGQQPSKADADRRHWSADAGADMHWSTAQSCEDGFMGSVVTGSPPDTLRLQW